MSSADNVQEYEELRFQARFWQSPFALSAAIVVCTQLAIIAYGAASGRPAPFDLLSMLTLLGATMLAAGIWPGWNFLRLNHEAVEQQAGLTGLSVPWSSVKSIDSCAQGLELVYVVRNPNGPVVRKARLLNRYGLSPDRFAEIIEKEWQRFGGKFA